MTVAAEQITRATMPDDGLHPDVPRDDYFAWNAASNSRLSKLIRSPAHLLESILHPTPPTPALILGDAAHLSILQPDLFGEHYIAADQCGAIKKDGKRCGHPGLGTIDGGWLCGVHAGKAPVWDAESRTVLVMDDLDKCVAMRDSVYRHPFARKLMGMRGRVELSGLFTDVETGARCKLRADKVIGWDNGIIVDLKTTEDASPRAFERSIFNYGYHRQAAFYIDGLTTLGAMSPAFCIVAIEKDPPFAVAVYRLKDEAVKAGREQLRPLLARYAECEANQCWPAYPDEPMDIGIPAWAMK